MARKLFQMTFFPAPGGIWEGFFVLWSAMVPTRLAGCGLTCSHHALKIHLGSFLRSLSGHQIVLKAAFFILSFFL